LKDCKRPADGETSVEHSGGSQEKGDALLGRVGEKFKIGEYVEVFGEGSRPGQGRTSKDGGEAGKGTKKPRKKHLNSRTGVEAWLRASRKRERGERKKRTIGTRCDRGGRVIKLGRVEVYSDPVQQSRAGLGGEGKGERKNPLRLWKGNKSSSKSSGPGSDI